MTRQKNNFPATKIFSENSNNTKSFQQNTQRVREQKLRERINMFEMIPLRLSCMQVFTCEKYFNAFHAFLGLQIKFSVG
jgi:hypothetical protein